MDCTMHYEIYLDGSLVDSTSLEGIAVLKWQSASLLGYAVLLRIEGHNDLVLGNRFMYDDEIGAWKVTGYGLKDKCDSRIIPVDDHLQSNALRVETMKFSPRCLSKMPAHWPEGARAIGALRWIGSGGSALVFGECNHDCPNMKVPS